MLRVMFSRISHGNLAYCFTSIVLQQSLFYSDISVDERHLTETANSKKLQRRRVSCVIVDVFRFLSMDSCCSWMNVISTAGLNEKDRHVCCVRAGRRAICHTSGD